MKKSKYFWIYKAFSFCMILSLMVSVFGISQFSTQAARLKSSSDFVPKNITRATSETIFGLTTTGSIVTFTSDAPGTILRNITLTGLQAGESLLGIDFRPATGALYGVGSTSRVYTINTTTGAATAVSPTPFVGLVNGAGVKFGVDFNPVPDRIRVVSSLTQNIRLNPVTGARADTPTADTNLAYAAGDPNVGQTPFVVEAAYTNNFAGATVTTLYDIDNVNGTAPARLVTQGGLNGTPSPNLGQLFTVGSTGVTTTNNVGFDISDFSATAYAALNPTATPTTSNLYRVNLTTGAATLVGAIGGGFVLSGLTVGFNGETLMALTASNKLLTFNSAAPNVITRSATVTGLQAGESLIGIDYRPATGELYGVGSTSRVYKINPFSGAATMVGAVPFSPGLNGVNFGVDFNPVPDRIRVVSDTTQNIRLNPITGARADTPTPDTNLAYATGDPNQGATPFVSGAAYTNSVAGATVTTLYDIDTLNGTGAARLVTQGGLNGTPSPNLGQLFTVGSTGVTTTGNVGFDISGKTGAAFASLTPTGTPTSSNLYTVNLTTGATTLLGGIAAGEAVRDITVMLNVEIITALNVNGQLTTFASTAPGVTLSGPVTVTGLQAGEKLVGIDYRPATGVLYGVGTTSRIYTINATTGAATFVASLTNAVGGAPVLLTGTNFGVDFNPVPDRIRVVSDTGQNLRINPDTGVTNVDGNINPGTPAISGVAYTNSFAGATATTLYDIDYVADTLSIQNPPNNGTLVAVGALGINVDTNVGFDISGFSGIAYAALSPIAAGAQQIVTNVGVSSNLYTINLATGAATQVGTLPIAGGVAISDIAIGPVNAGGLGQEHAMLIVADTLNNRLQRSINEGVNWTVIGGPGTGLGQFNQPRSAANDSTGQIIFVADTANNRVQRSTNGGVSWSVVAAPGLTVGSVNAPEGVAYDQLADTLYIADTANNRVQMFTGATTATPVASLLNNAGPGTTIGKFNGPTAVTVDANGNVYVCDTVNNRIQVNSTVTGWSLFAGAGPGTGVGLVNAPRGIFVDSNGRVLVADTGNNRIMVNLGATAAGWSVLFAPGTALGTVNAPRGVTVTTTGSVFVGDTGNNRIQKRTTAGVSTQVGAPGAGAAGQFNGPTGIR